MKQLHMEKSYVIVTVYQRVEEERGLSPDRSVVTSEVNASVKSSGFVSRCRLEASVLVHVVLELTYYHYKAA